MKNLFKKNWSLLYILAIIVFFVIGYNRAYAQDLGTKYYFSGVYSPAEILPAYCENCSLNLPAEYLDIKLVMSVKTNNVNQLWQALVNASLANDWQLIKDKNKITAKPIKAPEESIYYISCLDSSVHLVNKNAYNLYLQSDSIKCASRDSLQQFKIDSLGKIKPLDYKKYRLKYYSFTKSFTDKLGVSWNEILARGTLHTKPKIFDEWALYATETNDTSFTYRELTFSLDSAINIDWGSEEQTLKATYVNDGILYNEYEWRKYGLIIDIKRQDKNLKLSYIFRDKSSNIQLLQGQAIGLENDSLNLDGVYNFSYEKTLGVPFISQIPLIGRLFSTTQNITDSRQFQIFLIPYVENNIDSKENETGVKNETDGETKQNILLVGGGTVSNNDTD